MNNDDRPVGRLLSRRAALALFGASATTAVTALSNRTAAWVPESGVVAAVPDCVAQPEQTEGPYFVEEGLERSDIRLDPATGRISAGVPLELRFILSRVTPTGACVVLQTAQVDIWHCDASGMYSDVKDRSVSTVGQKFLRGYQVSDADGVVHFTTIYPGWYPGRAVHIHFKIRVPAAGGGTEEFTSQLYFSDALTDRVHAQAPYSAKKGQRLLNTRDMIFRDGGAQLILPVVSERAGYAATYRIAMQPSESRPAQVERRGPRGPRGNSL